MSTVRVKLVEQGARVAVVVVALPANWNAEPSASHSCTQNKPNGNDIVVGCCSRLAPCPHLHQKYTNIKSIQYQ